MEEGEVKEALTSTPKQKSRPDSSTPVDVVKAVEDEKQRARLDARSKLDLSPPPSPSAYNKVICSAMNNQEPDQEPVLEPDLVSGLDSVLGPALAPALEPALIQNVMVICTTSGSIELDALATSGSIEPDVLGTSGSIDPDVLDANGSNEAGVLGTNGSIDPDALGENQEPDPEPALEPDLASGPISVLGPALASDR